MFVLQQSEDYFIYHDRHFDVNLAAFLRGETPGAQRNGKKLVNGKPEEAAFGNVEARLPTLGVNQTAKDGEWQTVLGTRFEHVLFFEKLILKIATAEWNDSTQSA